MAERETVDPMVSFVAGLLTQALWEAKDNDVLKVKEILSQHVGASWETRLLLGSGKRLHVTVELEGEDPAQADAAAELQAANYALDAARERRQTAWERYVADPPDPFIAEKR